MAKSKKATKSESTGTKVRRVEVEETRNSSLIRDVLILAALILGLFLLYNAFADDASNGEAAVSEEDSKTEQTKGDQAAEADKDKASAQTNTGDTVVNETDKAYNFTVGAGESYTTMARRAVASLDGKLSAAERVAAETKLTQDAGAELLNLGQDLELSKETVRGAIDWAKGLSDEQKAAWQPYADLVAW